MCEMNSFRAKNRLIAHQSLAKGPDLSNAGYMFKYLKNQAVLAQVSPLAANRQHLSASSRALLCYHVFYFHFPSVVKDHSNLHRMLKL